MNAEETIVAIDKILAGDKEAFKVLISEYQRLVNHIVYRMVPDADGREDICQEVFMRVYQNLSHFRSDSKLSTWIARIAYNRCVDYLGRRKISVSVDSSEDPAEDIVDETSAPDRDLERADISSHLHAEISRLPAQFRTIITLYHLDGMSYAEIGSAMAIPEGTVKSYLFRARRMLKEQLMSKFSHEELLQ